MMRQLLYSELIKFKFELLSLIQWLKTINLFTINIQTYLSINLLVFIGIGINIFVLSTLPEIVYTQEIYDIIYYVGTVIYVLFVAFTNYGSLNYYNKVQFHWVNIIITVVLLLLIGTNKSIIQNILLLLSLKRLKIMMIIVYIR